MTDPAAFFGALYGIEPKPTKRVQVPVKVINTAHRVVILKNEYVGNRYDIFFVPVTNYRKAPF